MKKRSNKKANILTENIVFIVLNLVFLSILILFLFSKASDASFTEEKYAKEIALIIDSAKPGMNITLGMSDAVEKSKKENWDENKIVSIDKNIVTVKLHEEGGYSYAFFNDVELSRLYFYGNEGNNFKFNVERYK